jgi:hypothetical protein
MNCELVDISILCKCPHGRVSSLIDDRFCAYGKVEKGALISKILTRVGLGNDPNLVLKTIITCGVVA